MKRPGFADGCAGWASVFVVLFALASAAPAAPRESAAISAAELIYFSAEEYETDLDSRDTKARGEVDVHYAGRRMRTDQADIEMDTGKVKARGNVIFEQDAITIKGERADINMRTGLGHVNQARLDYDETLFIEAHKLEYLGKDRYRLEQGKFSFCRDCPQSWSVAGAWIEMKVEGYAEIHHALVQIKDRPVAYFPVFWFPIKTKRQSGLLMPQLGFAQELGTQIAQPYFWAIDTNADATFEYRYMTLGGHRLSSELRWLWSDRSFLQGQFSYARNNSAQSVPNDRYGISFRQRQQLSPRWTQRFEGETASDPVYTSSFAEEFRDARLPTLVMEPSVSWQSENLFFYGAGHFHRDNLIRNPTKAGTKLGPIHSLKSSVETASLGLLGPWRLSGGVEQLSLRRRQKGVDPVTGWIRTGDRGTARARLFAPFELGDYLHLESAVGVRGDAYNFGSAVPESSAARARLFTDQTLSTQVSKIWTFAENPEDDDSADTLKALRHSIEPTLRWSWAPKDARTNHPFFTQSHTFEDGRHFEAPKFDLFDPNSENEPGQLGTLGEEDRLGRHHLLMLGFHTRLVGRYGEQDRRYSEFLGASVEQDYDLRTERLGRLRIGAFGRYEWLKISTEMSINVENGQANVRNEVAIVKKPLTAEFFQSIRPKDEFRGGDIALGPLWQSWSFAAGADYDVLAKRVTRQEYRILYKSDASRCWFVGLDYSRRPDPLNHGKDLVKIWPNVGFIISERSVGL